MREIRIYQPGPYEKEDIVELNAAATQHVAVVLRMQTGDPLILFSGDNREFSAHIHSIKKKQVLVHIESVVESNRESPLAIHLAQALSKNDKMEWVIQKAVELGVRSIIPIQSERCALKLSAERMEKKWQQWQSISIAASEQSGRNTLTVIEPITTLPHFIKQAHSPLKWILNPQSSRSWRDYPLQEKDITVLIGPEGGLSHQEIALAIEHGFQDLSLGPRILRTETAAITTISLLQALAGDL